MLQNEEETSTVTTTTFITPEITTYYSTQTSSIEEDENDNENGYETDENGKEDDEGNGFTQTQTPVIDYSTFSTTGFTYVDNSVDHNTGRTTEDTEITSESTTESTTEPTTESIEDYSTKATKIFSTEPTLRSTLNYFHFFKNRTYITEPTTQYIYDVKSTTEHTTKSIPEFTSKKDFVQVNLSSY